MDCIRIFVASDPRMGKAEAALRASIEANTTGPVEVTFMRAGDPGWVGGPTSEVVDGQRTWDIGRAPGLPYSRTGWATDFTGFRWAIPELCGFKGRAIYQDVDQLDLGDMRELWEMEMSTAVLCSQGKSCVMLLDCGRFGTLDWWPSIDQIKCTGPRAMYDIRTRLDRHGEVDKSLGREWNFPDRYKPEVKVLHFTNMRTQPWKPWPDHFPYPQHPDQKACELFWDYYNRRAAS